jgi:hypothetical protein
MVRYDELYEVLKEGRIASQDEKDYERLCATGETFVYAAMTRLMAKRLARS